MQMLRHDEMMFLTKDEREQIETFHTLVKACQRNWMDAKHYGNDNLPEEYYKEEYVKLCHKMFERPWLQFIDELRAFPPIYKN